MKKICELCQGIIERMPHNYDDMVLCDDCYEFEKMEEELENE